MLLESGMVDAERDVLGSVPLAAFEENPANGDWLGAVGQLQAQVVGKTSVRRF